MAVEYEKVSGRLMNIIRGEPYDPVDNSHGCNLVNLIIGDSVKWRQVVFPITTKDRLDLESYKEVLVGHEVNYKMSSTSLREGALIEYELKINSGDLTGLVLKPFLIRKDEPYIPADNDDGECFIFDYR